VEVDVRGGLVEQRLGQDAQVRHAEEHVEAVLTERRAEVAPRVDDGDAVVVGVVAHLSVLRGDDDDVEARPARDVRALRDK
jgi:hypothetical protein